jgi:hypothetical protein
MYPREGLVTRRTIGSEGPDVVLRFVISSGEGEITPVEMRGRRLLGLLDDGDHVSIADEMTILGPDGIWRPRYIENRTTGSTVEAWRPPRFADPLRLLLTSIMSAAVGAVVSAFIGSILVLRQSSEPSPASPGPGIDPGGPLNPAAPETDDRVLITIILVLGAGVLVSLLLFYLVWIRRRRGRARKQVEAFKSRGQ